MNTASAGPIPIRSFRGCRLLLFAVILAVLGFPLAAQQAPSGNAPAPNAPQTPPQATLTVDEVLKDFDAGWQMLSESFFDQEMGGVDWKVAKDSYRAKVQAAANGEEAYKLFAEMVDSLKSPNTGVVPPWLLEPESATPTDNSEPLLQYGGVGLLLQPLESGDVFVLQVFKGTPAEKAGVLVGDTIVQVNDWRVTGDDALEQVTSRVRGEIGTKVTLGLKAPDGAERAVTMGRASIDLRPSVDQRIISGTVGYIRLPALTKDLVDQAAKSLPKLLSATSLVLDLRSVSSGNLDQMVVVAQWFLGAAHMGGFVAQDGLRALPYSDQATAAFTRPMVVLTNPYTYGVAEMLAFLLRQYKRSGIVGQPTSGDFEITTQVPLPSGGILQMAIARYLSPQGNLMPMTGLVPDVAVEPSDLATLRAGRDVPIEKAVEVLRTSPRW